mgnify:CR=1 FL=1
MDIGKIINHLSSRLRSRSQEVHTKLGIGNAQGKILNFILVAVSYTHLTLPTNREV